MLYTKFECHQSVDFWEEDFQRVFTLYMGNAPRWGLLTTDSSMALFFVDY